MSKSGPIQEKLLDKAKSLPRKPGCYLMKRKNGQVIYVGKAKDLKARVTTYFSASVKSPKTEILVSHIKEFEFLLTETEAEALVLENNLIKKYSPKYNVLMKDDKSYPYIVINHNEVFPRLEYKRRVVRKKGMEVFGPFVWGSNISEVLRIMTKSFQLRDCNLREFKSRKEPCLLYQIKQCSAPCVGSRTTDDYQIDLSDALNLFRGKGTKSLKILKNRMAEAAENEEFEYAAQVRDYITILEDFLDFSKQKNVELNSPDANIDILAFHPGEIEIDMAIYMIRNGILLGHKDFHFPTVECHDELEEELISFFFQYYSNSHDSFPDNIVTPFLPENNKLFEKALEGTFKAKVQAPGKKYEGLAKLAKDQAMEHQRVRTTNQDSIFNGLNKLKDLMSMKERPVLLECYDVAIFQGSSPAASQVVFRDGKPVKKDYRHYNLKELPEGNNDFAMMKEVLSRRMDNGNLPDIFIVDGGKGQVSMFQEVLKDFESSIPVVGIAKAKTAKGTEERLIIPGRSNPYILTKNPPLMRIIVSMRDEAHRFSRRLHHKGESKKTLNTWFDGLPGIGPKTKVKLLLKLDKSRDELREFSLIQLKNYFDVSEKIAKVLFKELKN
jgi:excinuclease ABC subunit C